MERSEAMSPRLGQKIKDNPKDKLLQVRVDNDTVEKLDYITEKLGLKRSDVVREGIEIQYKKAKRNKK